MPQSNKQIRTFDPSKPVMRRDGLAARITCTDRHGTSKPIQALIMNSSGTSEFTNHFHSDGSYMLTRESKYDLINIPVVRKGWVNMYSKGVQSFRTGGVYPSKDSARQCANPESIACIPIEFEEGEGLEDSGT